MMVVGRRAAHTAAALLLYMYVDLCYGVRLFCRPGCLVVLVLAV